MLRVPCETMRLNFKNTQKALEKNMEYAKTLVKNLPKHQTAVAAAATDSVDDKDVEMKDTDESALSPETQAVVNQLDGAIARMKGLKQKMAQLKQEHQNQVSCIQDRVEFLQQLFSIPDSSKSIESDEYKNWFQKRLAVMITDYLLRQGYNSSADKSIEELKEQNLDKLVDTKLLKECTQIENSLRKEHRTDLCFAWCQENKIPLKKIRSSLEFEVKKQHYIELVRAGKKTDAVLYYRTQLVANLNTPPPPSSSSSSAADSAGTGRETSQTEDVIKSSSTPSIEDMNFEQVEQLSGLIAISPDQNIEPYSKFYAEERWDILADNFVDTFQSIYALPSKPLFLKYLASGISTLKTHSCDIYHKEEEEAPPLQRRHVDLSRGFMCPVCSKELRKLAADLPFAMHSKSHLEPDPVVLPNNRIYGLTKLREYSKMVTGAEEQLMDPLTGETFDYEDYSVVYPT